MKTNVIMTKLHCYYFLALIYKAVCYTKGNDKLKNELEGTLPLPKKKKEKKSFF